MSAMKQDIPSSIYAAMHYYYIIYANDIYANTFLNFPTITSYCRELHTLIASMLVANQYCWNHNNKQVFSLKRKFYFLITISNNIGICGKTLMQAKGAKLPSVNN